jgi:hypothetical protein
MKDSGGNRTFITGSEMLNAIVSWIKETLNLPAHGMPMNAFHLFIDGSSRESVEVWEILKNAAAMQDAMLKNVESKVLAQLSSFSKTITAAGFLYLGICQQASRRLSEKSFTQPPISILLEW